MMSQEAAEKWREAALHCAALFLHPQAEQNEIGNWVFPNYPDHDGCEYTLKEALDIEEESDNLLQPAESLEITQDVLHQISVFHGEVKRVPRGEYPVVEIDLREDQYIINIQFSPRMHDNPERSTTDWPWTATVVTPLE